MVWLYSTSGNADGEGFIHKSKMNSNGTFSVGKTWKLNELRAVEVINVGYIYFVFLLRAECQHSP